MEQSNDPEKEEQEIIDKVRMDELKNALQSQIAPSKREEGQEIFTSSFDADEVDYERDSQAPEIEVVIDELDAIQKMHS